MTCRFGPYEADRTTYRVVRDGQTVDLTPKLLDLLLYLLERPATLVTEEELLDAVWPGANVTDNALAQAVSELRDALGDRAASPSYIKTVARRGYRFVAPVETVDAAKPLPTASGPGRTVLPSPVANPNDDDQPRTVVVLDFDEFDGFSDHLELDTGRHEIEFRADGYETYRGRIDVETGKTLTKRVSLKKIE